ncbi:3580_t:CDS:2 [Diversispora eburnea]|uniref:3580_t:CDS:1 n=1 Tax=Diversispora eburnea TaxID=1213867 RepID=A0A9N9AL17_9GLOM|nr:3580_t:CDS:2 [Diversispora eburnea]
MPHARHEVFAAVDENPTIAEKPETIEITGEFTGNPFKHVVNGQKNAVKFTFDNKGEESYTINLIGGALFNKDNLDQIVQNISYARFATPVPAMDHVDISYNFYAEFKPQEYELVLYVLFVDKDKKQFKGVGFNETVTIVDPDQSIFDLQLIFLYLILSGFALGTGYMIFQAFFGGAKTRKGKKRPTKRSVDDPAAGISTSSDKYDEAWIPDHFKTTTTATLFVASHMKLVPRREESKLM